MLLGLGVWQWQRGAAKSAIAHRLANNEHSIIVRRAPSNWSQLAYRHVELHGRWNTARTFLLANRVRGGRLGYEVFSPYHLAGDGASVLINRGWIDAHKVTPGATDDWLQNSARAPAAGILYLPQKGFTLGPAYHRTADAWPLKIQYMDIPALATALGAPLQPAAVALAAHHSAAFAPIWRATASPAARHYAYAAQWWGLALTLLIFGGVWLRRSRALSPRVQ